jgi:hypothetical protein
MQERSVYEVVEAGSGWQLVRQGCVPLVEFPTESQALRAAIAVCQDEGLARLVIRRACGAIEEVDPLLSSLDSFAA